MVSRIERRWDELRGNGVVEGSDRSRKGRKKKFEEEVLQLLGGYILKLGGGGSPEREDLDRVVHNKW